MLSVKHISLSGSETIVSATRVEYHPEPINCAPSQRARLTVFGAPDKQELHGGTVFVMNEAGKTISRYDLGASDVPQRAAVLGDIGDIGGSGYLRGRPEGQISTGGVLSGWKPQRVTMGSDGIVPMHEVTRS